MTSGAWTLPRINILHIFNYLSSSLRMPWSREHVSLSTSVKSSNKVVFLGSFPYCLYFGKHGVYHYHDCNSILLVVVVKILSYIEHEFRLLLSVPLDCYFLRQHRRCKTFLVSAGRIKVDSLVWVRDAFSIHLYLQSPLCPSRTFCLRNGCSCARRCQETRCQENVVSGSVASASSVSSDDQHYWWWCWRRR